MSSEKINRAIRGGWRPGLSVQAAQGGPCLGPGRGPGVD